MQVSAMSSANIISVMISRKVLVFFVFVNIFCFLDISEIVVTSKNIKENKRNVEICALSIPGIIDSVSKNKKVKAVITKKISMSIL
ncbi:MAG: hypothetical protein ACKUBY_04800 [Candidatus Moraniibacteriota bacterium]|jgi:hypothetical protein